MRKESQATSGAPQSPQRIWSNNGSEKNINGEDPFSHTQKSTSSSNIQNVGLLNQLAALESTDRNQYKNHLSSAGLNGKDFNKQVQFTANDSGTNQDFLKEAPNIRATKIDAINQKNGDSGEDIYMGTHTQERFKEKHFTFFQKRLLNTIVSENEDTLTEKRKNTTNAQTNSINVKEYNPSKYDSFNKNTTTQQNNVTKENVAGNGSKFQNSGRSGQNASMNQSQLRKSDVNKSDGVKKKITQKEIGERLWALKMWYICIIASIIGTIVCIVSFYISNSHDNSNILCFVIYPICAVLLQCSLIAIQRLIFIKIKIIEQEKAQQQSFNREKVNKKRFHSWSYFYTVYHNVSYRLLFFSIATVIVYAPIVEKIILVKIQPDGGIYELDENGDFVNSYNERRNFLLAQVILRFLWVYFIGFFNYILLNQEYTRIENLAKSEQNQNADRNQYLGQIYKEFENDLIQLENRMCVGLNQGSKTHTMAEFLRASFNDNGVNASNKDGAAQLNAINGGYTNSNVLNVPLTANQVLNKKNSLAHVPGDHKKSNLLDVNQGNLIVIKPITMNQFENNEIAPGPSGLLAPSGQTDKQILKQKTIERKKQQRIERVRDVLQFWMKIQREDIFAFTQNIFIGFTIILISVALTQNVLTNYLMEESEPGFYVAFVFYFFFISILFFKGVQAILRRQQEICKKVMRPVFFILASVGETSVHFELAQSVREAYVVSIIKFSMIIIFLHIVPMVQQIILERDIQKQVENVFRQSMQSRATMKKARTSNVDFRPSHIVDIKEISHFNDEKKVYQQNRLTLIQFLVAFCITDIASSVSFIAISFISKFDSSAELISVLHARPDYFKIYIVLTVEILCFLLMIILTIYFFKRSIANSEYDTLKNYSFVSYTRDLVLSNLSAIVFVYLFAWHFVFLLLNN